MKHIVIAALGLLLILCAGCTGEGELRVADAWARPGLTADTSAVYFTIDSGLAEDDILLNAASDAAEFVEVHATLMGEDGMMQMQHQENGVPVPAGGEVAFQPGGLHVMLVNLKQDLNPGDTLSVTLRFQNSGEITVEATVREP